MDLGSANGSISNKTSFFAGSKSHLARSHLSISARQIKLCCFPTGRFGDFDIAGLHVALAELKDDFQASRLPLVEDDVVGFWLSRSEGNAAQANSDKRHSDNQRSIATSSVPLQTQASLSRFELALVPVRFDHITSFIVNAIGKSGRRARSNNGKFRIFPGVDQRENRCKNEYLLGTATTQLELRLKNP